MPRFERSARTAPEVIPGQGERKVQLQRTQQLVQYLLGDLPDVQGVHKGDGLLRLLPGNMVAPQAQQQEAVQLLLQG